MRDDKSEGWETLKTKHSQIRKVSLGDIYIDPRFQRALGEHRKDQIAAPTRARVREGSRHYLTSAGQGAARGAARFSPPRHISRFRRSARAASTRHGQWENSPTAR